ncbi:hypothetical protein Goarm_001658 [Gossypium armourianum]|uniref:Isoamylase 1-3-like C-terminal domain-containing protein n=1 Tax=Gossypium armourianum TaxID=34283 RepID=A0A7J9K5Z9_9ROSI|nr:hypothetical protein [Gossypium armourianum]
MTMFRRECESLRLNDFPTAERLQWHGHTPGKPDWSDTSRFVAFTLIDSVKGEIYVAFNTSHLPVTITLPDRPGYRWEPLVDTSKPAPFDFLSNEVPERDIAIKQYAHFLDANLYPMLSYSSIQKNCNEVTNKAMCKAIEYFAISAPTKSFPILSIVGVRWHPPPQGWFKVNTNGFALSNPGNVEA